MKIADFDLTKEVLVVAEIGNNHEGSYSLAEELIGLAAEAGVGAVKFQTFRTERYVSRVDEGRFNRLKAFELSHDEFEKLSKAARGAGLIFLSTPFDLESAAFLGPLVPAFKIASGDNDFYPLLETVAGFDKPILLSTGLADLAHVRRSKDFIDRIWRRLEKRQELAVLHCVSSYPVPPSEANLAAIAHLRQELGCVVGYSDHTLGPQAAALAVALGARIIEKHFTINKHHSDFRDHQLSADPRELAQLVKRVKEADVLRGNGEKVIQRCEQDNLLSARRSIAAGRDLPKGATITWDDLAWTRPGGGLPPGSEHLVLGRSLNTLVPVGEMITPELLSEIARP